MTDAELLRMLEMRDRGDSAAVIGRAMGISRSAVLGHFKRINDECARHPCAARRAANRDGGMQPRWWARGLKRQRGAS